MSTSPAHMQLEYLVPSRHHTYFKKDMIQPKSLEQVSRSYNSAADVLLRKAEKTGQIGRVFSRPKTGERTALKYREACLRKNGMTLSTAGNRIKPKLVRLSLDSPSKLSLPHLNCPGHNPGSWSLLAAFKGHKSPVGLKNNPAWAQGMNYTFTTRSPTFRIQ